MPYVEAGVGQGQPTVGSVTVTSETCMAGSPFAVTSCAAADPKARVPVCSCW